MKHCGNKVISLWALANVSHNMTPITLGLSQEVCYQVYYFTPLVLRNTNRASSLPAKLGTGTWTTLFHPPSSSIHSLMILSLNAVYPFRHCVPTTQSPPCTRG